MDGKLLSFEDLVEEDIRRETGDEKVRVGKGHRLGGKSANFGLAALSRIKRNRDAYKGKEQKEEFQFWNEDHAESKSTNAGVDEWANEEEEETGLLVLFHLIPNSGSFTPRIDLATFPAALQGDGHAKGKREGRLSGPSANARYRLASVYFDSKRDGKCIYERYSVKLMGKFRTIFHLGEALQVHAVSMREVFKNSKENPFQDLVGNRVDCVGGSGPRERNSSTANTQIQSILTLDLPTLLDNLGEKIVHIQQCFEKYAEINEGEDVILGVLRSRIALEEAGVTDRKILNGASRECPISLERLDMTEFCRACNYSLCAGNKRGKISSDDAKRAFDRFKMFPEDDFVEAYDLPLVLGSLGIRQKQVEKAEDYVAKHRIERITFLYLLDLLHDFEEV